MPRSQTDADPTDDLGNAEAAAAIAECLDGGDILIAAPSEADAAAMAAALTVAVPHATIVLYPESDALPGHDAPASPANIGARNDALARLRGLRDQQGQPDRPAAVLVTTGEALAYACPTPDSIEAAQFSVAVGQAMSLPQLLEVLTARGYVEDDRVDEPGEVALHGQVLDVYPAQDEDPVRIEVADGVIHAISIYDLVDQRRIETIERVVVASALEPDPGKDRCALPDHLPDARLVISAAADRRRRHLLDLATEVDDAAAARRLLPDEAWTATLTGREALRLSRKGKPAPRFVEGKRPADAFTRAARAALAGGDRLALLGGERDLRFLSRRAHKLMDLPVVPASGWDDIASAAPGTVLALPMPCERGFRRDDILAIAAADLLGSRAEREDAVGPAGLSALPDPVGIRIGDVVVHEDHGIGVVRGIDSLPVLTEGDAPGDGIALGYADDAVRLVPVTQAHRIWRYGGDPDAVTLDRLDGTSWDKRKQAVGEAVARTASGLTDLAAARAAQTAPVLEAEPSAYERFCAGFPFTETADQARAIAAARDDLASGKPMDRLVIGDVGFGKTEIALRAAAIAVLAGRQVAIAAPTTVLARQHVETFTQRFAALNFRVGALHRLVSAAERKEMLAGLADGSIQIAVGTGAVAGKGVAYKDLGLVIIDEEQRFGAADKRKLRELSAGHVLTMTATPIPRTLQSALVGLQQMSVLATPPARRQPIRTSVAPFDRDRLRAALLRERARRGQSFVVVPRIEDMAGVAETLHEMLPDFTIRQAHGKLPAAEIDNAMIRFARGDGDVLLATNIIEAGLDVPRANTMVIHKADRFGLSQLHQLRGRVGRGNLRGQMLMFTEAGKTMPDSTIKRLQTLEALNRLGAGFEISARDLDLRGAGDLLGDDQAGHMKLIGIEFYQHLLEQGISRARGEAVHDAVPDLRLDAQGRLPEDWIADPDTRLEIYIRLARAETAEAVDLLEAELEDRFGTMPHPADTVLMLARLRAMAQAAGMAQVIVGPSGVTLRPREGHVPRRDRLKNAGLEEKDGLLLLHKDMGAPSDSLAAAMALLGQLIDSAPDGPATAVDAA